MSEALTRHIRGIVDEQFEAHVANLENLVRIPSVSWPAFDPAHLDTSAEAVAGLLRDTGVFDVVDIRRAKEGDTEVWGKPAVLAHRPAKNGKPTILLYAHHDVQPPGDEHDWDTAPFEPVRKGDRLFGRGASDDKAGVITHVAAIRALAEALGDEFDLGLAVFIEGEEEWASRSFGNFLRDNMDLLTADAIVVADSDNWDTKTPALTVALRGAAAMNVRVETLAHASHSGMFGGAVPDAFMAATQLLATLWNEDGSVAVEGLNTADIDTPTYSEDDLRREAGLLDGVTPIGTGSVLSRLWAQPAISLTGIDAPSIANASNTLIPSVLVRISARVAPGQDADEASAAIQQHLLAHAPYGAKITFEDIDNGQPFTMDRGGWAATAMKNAMRDAWETEPVDIGIGGSIPFISELKEQFPSAHILVTGVEDPETKAHSPNESQHLGVLRNAILTQALFLARLNSTEDVIGS